MSKTSPPAPAPRTTPALNLLRDTTYEPSGPQDGFEPEACFDRTQEHDSRKVDYPDDMYLVTTLPQSDLKAISRDGETECMCTGWFKRKVLSTPGFPSPIVHPPKIIYEVREAIGQGLGVFASEDVEPGDLIIAERPLLVKMAWNNARYRSDLTQEAILRATYANLEKSMEFICSRMSPQALEAYTSLHNSHRTDGSGPLTGIMRTNGFGVGTDDPAAAVGEGDYTCVGTVASRFNHSCLPNAAYSFDMPSFSIQIHALRPIAKGEEMTVAYIAVKAPAAERQIALRPYGFTCTCMACKNPEVWDKERTRVVVDLLPKTSQGVKNAERVLAAYEATGLHALSRYTELLDRVAQINRKWGNKDRANALESLAKNVTTARKGRHPKLYEEDLPIRSYTFESADEMLKFIMQNGDPAGRANMMRAFMQIANPDPSKSTKVHDPSGMEMIVHASDSLPRPSGL